MSDTPRTDAIVFHHQPGMMHPYDTVPANFARQLERELNEAHAREAQLREELDGLYSTACNV